MAKKTMFSEDYLFRGSHRDKVVALTSKIDVDSNSQIFSSAVELFIFASLIGVLKNRKSEPERDNTNTFRIMSNQFFNHIDELKLAFKFVILTSEKDCIDPVTRLNKAFRNPETDENYSLFEKFMLGGINELYENLILDTNVKYEDYLTSVNELLSSMSSTIENEDETNVNTDDFKF
ncbi:MAG: hypothetical protein ACLSUV_01670 [Bacilli bacterium]